MLFNFLRYIFSPPKGKPKKATVGDEVIFSLFIIVFVALVFG